MKKKQLVRFELLALAAVILLVAYRVVEGPPAPKGLVVYTDLKPGQLQVQSFTLHQPRRFVIDAVGSFSSTRGDAPKDLAAYGWLLRREDRAVAWKMSEANVRSGDGSIAIASDTVELAPGTYDVYYTSFGNERNGHFSFGFFDRLFGDGEAWRNDARKWRFVIRSGDDERGGISRIDSPSGAERSPREEGLLWSTAPMKGHQAAQYVFQTSESIPLRVYAVGEIDSDNDQMDFGWMEDAVSGERLWEMNFSNTTHAGGWEVNRMFAQTYRLEPGIYRTAFVTDPGHHFEDWYANPPFDPAAWGVTLYTSRPDAVHPFDPWVNRTPIVQIMEVGDYQRRSAQFQVHEPLAVTVYAMGELSDDERYDYAWITNNDTQETVWEMTREHSIPAEGDNNRIEMAFLDLNPGTYTITYETDGSHSFDSWRHGEPQNPERWGVSMFPLNEGVDSTVVQVLAYNRESLNHEEAAIAPMPNTDLPPLPPMPGETIVDLSRLGNEKDVQAEISLDEPSMLHVRAIGEISLSGRYDYGWIENPETGEIVWEMTWQNTGPAGGDDWNRIFDGPISLEPGQYIVHFRTDFSHAYGDFDDQPPNEQQGWGIRISRP